jgi:hypothetical protein
MNRARLKDSIYDRVPTKLLTAALPLLLPSKSPFLPPILERRAIFIHVPKAAGSSLKEEIYGERVGGHRRIAEFRAYDPGRTADFYKFTFVRNPWDRLLSAYSYLQQGVDSTARDRAFASRYLSQFRDFEAFVIGLGDRRTREPILHYDHFRPQSYWMCLPGQRDHALDFVGRFESMERDLAAVRHHLGLPARPLGKSRSSRHQDYMAAYSPAMIDIVAGIYSDDIDLLGYGFGSET